MKQLILFFLLGANIAAQAQFFYYPFPPEKSEYILNENAKVKIGYEYRLTDNEKLLYRTLEYGNEGLPVALYESGLHYNGDSAVITTNYYKYKEERLIEDDMVFHYQDDAGYTIAYTYDDTGKLLSKIVIDIDPITYTYMYDKFGKITQADISLKMPDSNGNPIDIPNGRCTYSYNENGKLMQEIRYSKDNEKQFTYTWEYNNKGQIVKVSGTSAEEQTFYECLLEYGKNNLLSKRTANNQDEDSEVYIYEYCTDCKQSRMK